MSAILFQLHATGTAWGQMQALSEHELATVTGQSGVSLIVADLQFDWAADYITIYDTDSDRTVDPDAGTLSFHGLTLLNGVFETLEAITLDAYTIDDAASPMDGRTFTLWQAPDLYQRLYLTVDDMAICGQSIGRIDIDNFTVPQQYWTTGAHDAGIDFQFDQQMHVDRFAYTYNTTGMENTFELAGIHLVGSFDDMADFDIADSTTWDIPTDPSQWTYSGVFSIGDIDNGNPATLDIGADAGGQTVVRLALPMQGSIRVENLHVGAYDFGPLAIDGLQVHRLTITLPGSD